MTQHRTYKAKRSTARWLTGAPDFVLACFDHGDKFADRYTIIFGGDKQEGDGTFAGSWLHCLHIGAASYGSHPGGWSDMRAHEASRYRYAMRNKKIAWADLPECIRGTVAKAFKDDTAKAA